MHKGKLIVDRMTPNGTGRMTYSRSTETIVVTFEEAARLASMAILDNPTNDSLQITFTPEE